MATRPGSICLVANELGENGALAVLLASAGWRARILWCQSGLDARDVSALRDRLAEFGVALSVLADFELPPLYKVPHWFTDLDLQCARAWQALEELQRLHGLDLIQFPDRWALGFRAIQAKRAGLTFHDVGLIVRLEGCSQWQRECNYRWMNHTNDLLLDFAERFAFEQADYQVSASRHLMEYAQAISWKVRDDLAIVPSPLERSEPAALHRQDSWPPEIVFVGDLDERFGLKVFVKAVQQLPADIALVFLGKDSTLPDGVTTSSWVEERLADRNVLFLTNLNREETLGYLARGGRLAVMPCVSAGATHLVAECALRAIPFVAARTGDIPETIPDVDLQNSLLCEPNAKDLLRCLSGYLKTYWEQRRLWRERALEVIDAAGRNGAIADFYWKCLDERRQQCVVPRTSAEELPLVTVAIPHCNLGAYLPETLASVAAQTYPNLEVIVLDDGSSDEVSLNVFEAQKQLYPQFTFLRQENAGVCTARNRMLAVAKGDLFFPLDADNIIMPRMLERLATSLLRNPEYSAMSCFRLDFRKSEDLIKGAYVESYRPMGGPYVLASIDNVYGETSGLFRTAALRAVGGYEDLHPEYVSEDWQIYVKLASLGYGIGVVPEHLYYYRLRGDSRYHNGNLFITHQQILNCYAERTPELTHAERVELWNALVSLHRLAANNHERLVRMDQHARNCQAYIQYLEEQVRTVHAYNVNLTNMLHESEEKSAQLAWELGHTKARLGLLRYRLADRFNAFFKRVPLSHHVGKSIILSGLSIWRKGEPERKAG